MSFAVVVRKEETVQVLLVSLSYAAVGGHWQTRVQVLAVMSPILCLLLHRARSLARLSANQMVAKVTSGIRSIFFTTTRKRTMRTSYGCGRWRHGGPPFHFTNFKASVSTCCRFQVAVSHTRRQATSINVQRILTSHRFCV